MYKLTILALPLLATLAFGCKSGSVPESSIYLIDGDTDQIIATANTPGDLTLNVGEVYDFKVERLQSSSDDTETSDVTTVSTYIFIPEDIAVANSLGELRALSPGTTRMEARFRPDGFESADRVYLDITVVP